MIHHRKSSPKIVTENHHRKQRAFSLPCQYHSGYWDYFCLTLDIFELFLISCLSPTPTFLFLTWHCKVEISFTPLAQYLHDYVGFCAQPVWPALGKKKQGSQEEVPSNARFPSKVTRSRFPSKASQEEVAKRNVARKRFPGKVPKRFQARFPGNRFPSKGSQARVPSKRFPSKVPRNRFCKHGFQEPFSRFPGTISQARFPGTCFSKQNKVPRTGFVQTSVSRKKFPRRGVQSKVPSKLVPKQYFQEEVPKQGSQPQVPRNRCPHKVPKNRFTSKVPRKRFPSNRFPGTGSQTSFPITGSRVRFPEKFPSNVSRKRFPSKVPRNRV